MKRASILLTVLAAVLYLSGTSALAQGRGQGGRPRGPAPRAPRTPGKPPTPQRPATLGSERGNIPATSQSTTGMENKKAVADLLAQNTKLSSRLQTLLPEGTNLEEAASNYKNLGLFVASVHVSHNLGIPFDDLKEKVVTDEKSLGEAIHELKPDLDAEAEAQKAQKQAQRVLAESKGKKE